jgi:hypothetical protein
LPLSLLLNKLMQEMQFLRLIETFLLQQSHLLATVGSLEPILHVLDQTSESGGRIRLGMGLS